MLPTCKTVQEFLFQPHAATSGSQEGPHRHLKERSVTPTESVIFGLAALAERQNLCWVDGIVADLHFDDFAVLAIR